MNNTEDRPTAKALRSKAVVDSWDLAGSVDQQSLQLARLVSLQRDNDQVHNLLIEERIRSRRRRNLLYISGIGLSVLSLIVVSVVVVTSFGIEFDSTNKSSSVITVVMASLSLVVSMFSIWSFRNGIKKDRRTDKFAKNENRIKVVHDSKDGKFYILDNKVDDGFR
ncbi:hypothetical protein [Brevibacterium spongiae]|uniref:DUF4231 domain-containing protein n=1 Tax=Brevibacterium spongiae TaxID=2909672 RepID=A0ABY5SJS5_9MICO|nr:hypothetical protein [Brevibacterium spongiae]UVI34770.1 hypothetical protein L1F31_11605 [Brevibacterium spongiae]